MDTHPRDEHLWRIAKKRAGFKRSLLTYVIINAFLWAIWWFSNGREYGWRGIPWPLWVMLGWGIGLLMQYINAYGGNKQDLAEREYNRLRDQQQRDRL